MEFWIKAAQLILSLSILVVLHEFGHYIPARIFKTRVEKFYLFFNWKFSLFKKKIGETEWGIGWIPLGGYVKIAGMIDESMDKEQMKEPAKPWEFRSKPAWQRLIIMTGGVIVNLILGMIIYVLVLFAWGEEKVHISKLDNGMMIHPYMEQFGIHSGDNILAINGEKITHTGDIARHILMRGGRELKVEHADGSIEMIKLPETIDYDVFKNVGQGPLASLRTKEVNIRGFQIADSKEGAKYDAGFEVKKIDGKRPSQLDLLSEDFRNKGHKILVHTGKEFQTIQLTKGEFKQFLNDVPALNAGLHHQDKIVAINGERLEFTDQFVSGLYNARGKELNLTVSRFGNEVTLTAEVPKSGLIGIAFNGKKSEDIDNAVYTKNYSFGASFGAGISRGYWTLHDYVSQMKFLFTKKGVTSMGGFGAIGGLFSPTWDWHSFWLNTALISIILAFMNILPIPALDGGHVVFLLYEMITGREAPEKVLEIAQYIGFFLILGLVLFANGNDIYKAIFGG